MTVAPRSDRSKPVLARVQSVVPQTSVWSSTWVPSGLVEEDVEVAGEGMDVGEIGDLDGGDVGAGSDVEGGVECAVVEDYARDVGVMQVTPPAPGVLVAVGVLVAPCGVLVGVAVNVPVAVLVAPCGVFVGVSVAQGGRGKNISMSPVAALADV